MKLSLADRIRLSQAASDEIAEERLLKADRLMAEEPPDEVKQALEQYAISLRKPGLFETYRAFLWSVLWGAIYVLIIVQSVWWLSGSKHWIWEVLK